MIGPTAAPGPCQGQAANCPIPTEKTVGGNHGDCVDAYGDNFRSKLSKICRITFFNPNGMGYKANSFKMTCLYSFLRRHKVDFMGLSETNVDWRMVDYKDNVWGRMTDWFEAKKISVAHNRKAPQRETVFQAGGTVSLTMDRLANVRGSVGYDERDLGRWSWILTQGKGQVKTRFITVYCPCKNTKVGNSTYQQQLVHFRKHNMDVCPIKQFWDDLIDAVQVWIADGDQIVLGGDWNHPIATVNRKLDPLGLREAITSHHGLDDAPATHKRGSCPIDGIYVNSTLQITRGGYLPFNKGVISDHRILWIDVPLDSILGFSSYDTVIPKARRLKNRDPRVKKKYQDYCHSFAIQHNLYNKAAKLLAESSFPMSPSVAKKWKSFEKIRTDGMIAAEKRCRKLRRGIYDWSPEFSRIRDLIKLWTMVKDRKNKANVSVRAILKVAKRVNVEVDFGLTMAAVRAKLDEVWVEYQKVKRNAPNLRLSYLRSLALAKANNDETLAATKLRQMIHTEEQRRQVKAIKYTTGKLFGSGLTRVLVPSHTGHGVVEITDRFKLEQVLLDSNPIKYHRCEEYCELMRGQLLADIGLCGDGPAVDDILNGTYVCPDDVSEGTKMFLDSMKRHPDCKKVAHIGARSSVEELCGQWKRAKESSSSHGPLHNGHFKAGFEHPSLRYLHFACAEILYISGYYLDRHRQGTDVMLLKSTENYHLDKLRTICLLDSELNMNMGRVGTDGLNALMGLDDMADEQYSRPCRSAIDHVVNRKLSFDYFTFCRHPFGLCSCDLAGNYDRIAHAAASLALQRVGVPRSRIVGLFDTLQRMIKNVRTAFGDSIGTYGGEKIPFPYTLKPMGVYQGNRIGPPIWSVISSTVFSILRRAGFGVQYINALSTELYHLVGFAYVDDSDLIQSGSDAFKVARDMQDALSLWEDIMRATGQSMAPNKSWWYLVDFVWRNGKWSYCDGATRSDLVATDTDGNKISLKRLIHSEAKKMLGVFLSPSGNRKPQLDYLRSKARAWADMIRVGHLGPTDTWIALSSGIWKSLMYPLPVTTFTAAELRSISGPILEVALPRMSLTRSTPLALRYGPRRLGGYGMIHLGNYQGISKIQYLVEHPWRGTPTGKIIDANVSCLVLECGVYGNIFSIPSDPLQWTTAAESWVGYAWAFMSHHNIRIDNYRGTFLSPSRSGDTALMPSFASAGASVLHLQALNRCRLYLKVVSLSDISSADGISLIQSVFSFGRKYPAPLVRNSFEWPTQGMPSSADWKLWNDSLIKCFCLDTSGKLRIPLGAWLQPSAPTHPTWDWHAVGTSARDIHRLWFFDGTLWTAYVKSPTRTRHQRFVPTVESLDPLADFHSLSHCRVTITELSGPSVEIGSISLPLSPCMPEPAQNKVGIIPPVVDSQMFFLILQECEEIKWFIKRVCMPDSISDLVRDFLAGRMQCVSDGSYHPLHHYGTANWRLESVDRSVVISGYCVVPGERSKQNSFRSELAGLLGLSSFIWGLAKLVASFGVPPPQVWEVIVGCDGYSALQKALVSSPDRLSSSYKHFDLVSAIMGFWRDMPCSPFAVHVSGHQDEVCPRRHLSRLELMNISADRSAQAYLHSCLLRNTPTPTGDFSFGFPTVTYRGRRVSSDLLKTLLDWCSEQDIMEFWKRNWKFSDHDFESLAWPAFERAMRMTARHEQKFVVKWLSRMVTVGVTLKRTRADRCLRCNKENETLSHCLRCQAVRPSVTRRLNHFFSLLEDFGTNPLLLEGIKLCCHHWLTQSRSRPIDFLAHLADRDTVFVLVWHYQFGWFHFLQGLHFRSLTILQANYFTHIGSTKSVSFWYGRVISSIWQFLIDVRAERKDFLADRRSTLDPSHPAVRAAFDSCRQELALGLGGLPPLYRSYFTLTATTLLSREASVIRNWLRTVRLARETLESHSVLLDDFSPHGKHRTWLLSF